MCIGIQFVKFIMPLSSGITKTILTRPCVSVEYMGIGLWAFNGQIDMGMKKEKLSERRPVSM